jgi:mannose-6-phosphate isomerase
MIPSQTKTGSQYWRKRRIRLVRVRPSGRQLNKWHFTETPYKFTPLKSAIRNPQSAILAPLTFEPIFMERMWGGRRLKTEFGKKLPANKRIGESWEIVDRPEAQSVVARGPLQGKTLHELWMHDREEVFGEAGTLPSDRFPLLIKLLDAREKLSLQVHPSEKIAGKLKGEPKTEFWYVAAADPDTELFLGFREPITRDQFEKALRQGTVADHVHTIRVKTGDAMLLPAGRFHGIGSGNLLVEIQQNSDTTYRVFDWNRINPATGKPRQLHVDQALECIDFNDVRPNLIEPKGELLVRHELFEIQKWNLDRPREVARPGDFAVVCCLSGKLRCVNVDLAPGEFFLVPAQPEDRQLKPLGEKTSLLRVTIPV